MWLLLATRSGHQKYLFTHVGGFGCKFVMGYEATRLLTARLTVGLHNVIVTASHQHFVDVVCCGPCGSHPGCLEPLRDMLATTVLNFVQDWFAKQHASIGAGQASIVVDKTCLCGAWVGS